jgi:hypothetical protein
MQHDANKPALWKRLPSRLSLHWRPIPIEPPQVDQDETRLPPIERSAEVIRYSLLKMEYWISPNGRLREWLRFNLAVAFIIGIPALLIVPIVTLLLGSVVTWADSLAMAAWNLVRFVGSLIAAIALITAALAVFRAFRGR